MKIKYFINIFFIFLLHNQIQNVTSQKIPILLFHGVTSSPEGFYQFKPKLEELGYAVIAIDCFTKERSTISLWEQIEGTIHWIRSNVHTNPIFQNGYHAIGYSQGGMILRGVAQMMPDHHIKHLITLGSPLNGFYLSQKANSNASIDAVRYDNLPENVFHILAHLSENGVLQNLVNFLANRRTFQSSSSILNLWHVPTNRFYSKNEFIPILNNNYHKKNKGLLHPFFIKMNSTDNTRKENFLKIEKFYSLYSSQDEVINPKESAALGYYKDVENKVDAIEILPMEKTKEYINDSYGLRTLDKQNRLTFLNIPNIIHTCWITDVSCSQFHDLFNNHIIPLLN